MRILFYSNAPWAPTGYGNQTAQFVKHLNNLGHQLAVACNYGLHGARIDGGGVTYYPAGHSKASNEIVQAHADDFKADVIVSLYDVWAIDFSNLRTPWVAWTMVDHDPLPKIVADAVTGRPDKDGQKTVPECAQVVACSKFGQRKFDRAGINAAYIPLGVDTTLFERRDKAECRQALNLPPDAFIVGFVGANKFWPSRKCIPQVLQAFSTYHDFLDQQAMICLHTEEQGVHEGVPLKPLLDALELGAESVRVCDQYHYAVGHSPDYMVTFYNAIDVLINPSMGEGFGIPIMEAQACGTPVIVNDFTAMTELVAGGWVNTEYERWWSRQSSWQVIPHVKGLVSALDQAATAKKDAAGFQKRRTQARQMAGGYDFEKVVAPMWDSLLKGLTL